MRDTLTDRVAKAVYAAIDGLNEQLSESQRLEMNPDTVLLGNTGKLDSIGFINLIVLLEDKCRQECGVSLSLGGTDEISGSNPFETVATVISYLERQVREKISGGN